MPLDPFFAERLRSYRRYVIKQAIGDVKRRLGWQPVADKSKKASTTPLPASAASAPAKPAKPTPAAARAKHRRTALGWDRTEQRTVGTPGPDLRTSEHLVPVAGFPDVRVRVYYPDGDGTFPACLTFYGGAFRLGGIDYPTTDAAHRRRTAASGVAHVAVDYALAPEHRYPTQVEQAYAALEWVVANAGDLGLDSERVAVDGASAGACIAAAVTLMNRDRAQHPIRLQILEVPVVDLSGKHVDFSVTRSLGLPSPIVLRELGSVRKTYLGREWRRLAREPYASPLLAASLERLPPAVIFTAEYDPLRAQGDAYLAALRAAGVDASAVRYLGVTHYIAIFTGALATARRWEAEVVSALRTLHNP